MEIAFGGRIGRWKELETIDSGDFFEGLEKVYEDMDEVIERFIFPYTESRSGELEKEGGIMGLNIKCDSKDSGRFEIIKDYDGQVVTYESTFDNYDSFKDSFLTVCYYDEELDITYEEILKLEDIGELIYYSKVTGVHNGEVTVGCNVDDVVISDYSDWIKKYSEKYGVDPILVLAIMIQESACDQSAGSIAAAYGLMQLTEGTFNDVCKDEIDGLDVSSFVDIKNSAEANIACGAKILKDKYDRYGSRSIPYSCSRYEFKSGHVQKSINEVYSDWEGAIRGYNGWGCAKLTSSGKEIHADHYYVEKVVSIYNKLKEEYSKL
jgi:hypothetical protein